MVKQTPILLKLKIVVIDKFLLVMTTGITQMLKLSVECLDSVQMVQWQHCSPPMDQCPRISSWMMSTALEQKRLWKIVTTTQGIIVEVVKELGSFVEQV